MLLYYVISDLILIMSISFFCRFIFGFKLRVSKQIKVKKMMAIMGMAGVSILINRCDYVIAEIFIYYISIILFMYIIYDEKISLIFISSLWTTIIVSMLNVMTSVIFDMMIVLKCEIHEGIEQLLRALFLLCFTLVVGGLYRRSVNRGMKTISKGGLIIFTCLAMADTFIVMVISYFITTNESLCSNKEYVRGFMLVVLGLFLQLGAVIIFLMQRNDYKEAQQITLRYLEEQKNHYEYLEKRERETKKFRHDLRNHMEILMALVVEHKYTELKNYMDKININIDKFGSTLSVQNGIVDAIINKYYSEAEKNNIAMKVTGRLPKECEIEAYDLCTIFSNILSNAIEGAAEIEKGWISIECRYTENNMLIVVNNTFDYQNPKRKNITKTHKQDTNYHGFGLENVREAIKKYNGVCDTKINENVYSIRISLNYRSAREYEDCNS